MGNHSVQSLEQSYFPTVSELLESPSILNSRLVAGAAGLDRKVSASTQIDSPDFMEYLTSDEIIVTNLYAICNDEDKLRECIPEMASIGISALFLKANWLPGKCIPDYMIEQADKAQMPLIELDWNVDFYKVGQLLSDEIARRRNIFLHNILSINRMLNQIITEEAGLERISEMISGLCRGSVMIIDSINTRQHYHLSPEDEAELSGKTPSEIISAIIENGEANQIVVGENNYGYLYIYHPTQSPALSQELLDQVLSVIPLEISREQSFRVAASKMFGNFLAHLLSDPILDEQHEFIRAREFGLPLDAVHRIIRLQLTYNDQHVSQHMRDLHHTLLVNRINAIYRGTDIIVHSLEMQDGFLILITDPSTPGSAKEESAVSNSRQKNDALRNFQVQLQSFETGYPELKIASGVGRPYSGIGGLIQTNREARIALESALSGKRKHVRYEDMGMLRLLYTGDIAKEMKDYIDEIIGPLIEFDHKNNGELLTTLDNYIRCSGNIKRISEESFTHYNTIAYRVKSIHKITGRDLRNPDDLYELETALRLYKFLIY